MSPGLPRALLAGPSFQGPGSICANGTQKNYTKEIFCSPPGSSDHGFLQARILEWIAMPFSRRSS